MKNYFVTIVSSRGEELCEIQFEKVTPVNVKITTKTFGVLSFSDDNLFGALLKFRILLEKHHYLLLCNAARKDAYPSRMSLEMGGGRTLYLLNSGVQTRREDLVDALDAASIDQVGTVEEQRDGYQRWIRSLK